MTTASRTRERLLEAALQRLAVDGPEGLQARKLAADIGASTMSVYTHFGGLPELVEEVTREGFRRFARCLEEVPDTSDPVADLFTRGLAYRDFALNNSHLYMVMFGVTAPGGHRFATRDLTADHAPTSQPEGLHAFAQLLVTVDRVVASGRVEPEEPVPMAAQLWSMIHGYVLMEIAGFFGADGRGVDQVLIPLGVKLLVGAGDSPARTLRSVEAARARPAGPRG